MAAEERWMPADKDELLSAIEREWKRLQDVASGINPGNAEIPDAGGLSPKDHLAHLAEWMKILMGFYMDLRRAHEVLGVAPEVTQKWDFEARNQLLFERNRNRSLEDVTMELQQVFAELTARLDAITFEELMKPQHPFDPERRPLMIYVLRATTEHFAEHRGRIEEQLRDGGKRGKKAGEA